MSKSPNLVAKKPISVWNKLLKADFKSFFTSIDKAGIDAATGQWVDLGKDAVDALSAIGLEINAQASSSGSLLS
ncbi:MAG: hypothetical protein AAFR31_21395, partial [Cyanobacteria bacterium J06627_8]